MSLNTESFFRKFKIGLFLTKSEFENHYEKSFFGVLWLFIQPFSYILPWILLEKFSLFNPGQVESSSFFSYSMRNLIFWTFFQVNLSYARRTLSEGRFIYHQINYDHTIFLYKGLVRSMIQTFFMFILFICLHYSKFSVVSLFTLPLTLIPVLFLSWGIGLQVCLLDTISVEMRKIGDLISLLLFWATPIVYAPGKSSMLEKVTSLNPLSYLLDLFHKSLEQTLLPHIGFLIIVLASSLLFYLYSLKVFRMAERKLFQRILS